jgi:hypothetical protein
MIATTEFVVPKSMPIILDIPILSLAYNNRGFCASVFPLFSKTILRHNSLFAKAMPSRPKWAHLALNIDFQGICGNLPMYSRRGFLPEWQEDWPKNGIIAD